MLDDLDIIYEKEQYVVWEDCGGYVVWNTDKNFHKGHTHLESFTRVKEVIDSMLEFNFPLHFSNYFIISMQRLSNNKPFTEKLKEIHQARLSKGKKLGYRNINNGAR